MVFLQPDLQGATIPDLQELVRRAQEALALHPNQTDSSLRQDAIFKLALTDAVRSAFGNSMIAGRILFKLSPAMRKEIEAKMVQVFGAEQGNRRAQLRLVFESCMFYASDKNYTEPTLLAKLLVDWPGFVERDFPGYIGAGILPKVVKTFDVGTSS